MFGGGPVLTANPEPFAAFFDIILLGDGETLIDDFLDRLIDLKSASRAEKLRQLAQVSGVYVPALYHVTYDGPTGGFWPSNPPIQTCPQRCKSRPTEATCCRLPRW